MCRPWKWLWGLIPLALIALVGLGLRGPTIQADLTQRATAQLAADGQGWASVQIAGRDARLVGDAPNDARRQLAAQSVDRTWGVRRQDVAAGLLAAQNPYTWAATRQANRVTLTGFAPSNEAKASITQAARQALPGVEVVDQMQLAAGSPPDNAFTAATGFGIAQLARLSEGRSSLSNLAFSVEGRARDLDAFGQVREAVRALPSGVTLAREAVLPPVVAPYTWGAQRAGDTVTLTGFVPSEDVRGQIVARVRQSVQGAQVVDQMRLGDGAPAVFGPLTNHAVDQLGRLSEGRATSTDAALTIEGVARTPTSFGEVRAALATMPQGSTLAREAVLPPAVSPYVWGAELQGANVTLTGLVPSDEQRQQIMARARQVVANAQVTDRMQVAAGAPAGHPGAVGVGLDQLGRLTNGRAAVSDAGLTLEGLARTPQTFAEIGQAVAAMPQGTTLAANRVTAPPVSPYTFGATYDGSIVTLTGHVPDQAARERILAQVQAELPNRQIVDRMLIASGAPSTLWPHASFGLAQLPRFSRGEIAVVDTALTVNGTALSPDAYAAATTAVRALPQGATLAASTIVPPTVSPYVWGAEFTGQALNLTGFVPSDATRAAVLERARAALPNVTVNDRMQVAQGPAPDQFRDTVSGVLGQFTRFTTGNASIRDAALTISGQARDFATYDAAIAQARQPLPAGFTLASATITPPVARPFTWTAARDAQGVTLSGVVPSEEARTNVVAATRQRFPGAAVTDQMRLAAGAPNAAAWPGATTYALDRLAALRSGRATVEDAALALSGEAATVAIRDQVVAQLGTLPTGVSTQTNAITVPPTSPFAWTATRAAGAVTLTGVVPSTAVQRELVQAATQRFAGERIVDQTTLAEGAPPNFAAMAGRGVDLLARLQSGVATVSDRAFTLQGAAGSEAVKAEVDRAATQGLPQGFTGTSTVSAPPPPPPAPAPVAPPPPPLPPVASPFGWSATRADGAITLRGVVPSQEVKTELAAQARRRFPEDRLVDETTIARTAPANFQQAAVQGLDLLSRLRTGTASLRDTAFRIEGAAASQAIKEDVDHDATRAFVQGFQPTSDVTAPPLPPVASPFGWSATRADGAITLRGVVPSQEVKTELAAQARRRFPEDRLVDETTIARTAPANFQQAAVQGLDLLSRLRTGTAALRDTAFRIEGAAASQAIKEDVDHDATRAFVQGFQPTSDVTAPAPPPPAPPPAPPQPPVVSPYVWSATRANGAITLRGVVPTAEVKTELANQARRRFPEDRLVDETTLARTAPGNFQQAATQGLDLLSRLRTGTASLRDTLFRIEGAAASQAIKDDVDFDTFRGFVAGFAPISEVTAPAPPPPPVVDPCVALLRTAQERGRINFRTARAEILPNSRPVLDGIVAVLRQCPNARVAVEGHTDADGATEMNQDLSERRAQAVVDYLVRAGIARSRLTAVGFGETRPIASNETAEGKAQNRRIEFTIQP